MPVKIEMKPIIREDLTIPGGWTAKIPQIQATPESEYPYTRYFVNRGIGIYKSETQIRESFQALFNSSWLRGLREMLVNRAREYMELHPDLDLRGFDPETLQSMYIPGDHVGSPGKKAVRNVLRSMGKQQRETEK